MSDFIESVAAAWDNDPALAAAVVIALKAFAILAVTGIAARVLWRASAAKQHLLWSAGIGAAVVIPFATLSLPSWRIPVRYSAARVPTAAEAPALRDSSLGPAFDLAGVPVSDVPAQMSATLPPLPVTAALAAPVVTAGFELGTGVTVLGVWLLGALLALWPWFAGVKGRSRLTRNATDLLPGPWERSLRTLRAEGLVPARVQVLASPDCSTPMTWGIVRPIVLVPEHSDWQQHERRNALLHEFAHVRRGDYLCKLGARILCSIYWFNPFAWVAARAERLTRELACDDAVLRAGSRPSTYAQQLLEVAHGQPRQIMAAAALTMARRSNLSRRLRAILDNEHDRSPTGRRFSSVALGAAFALVPPLAAMSPDWVRVVQEIPVAPQQLPNEPALTALPQAILPDSTATPDEYSIDVQPAPVQPLGMAQTAASSPVLSTVQNLTPQQAVCSPNPKRSNTSIQSNSDGGRNARRWQVRWSDGVCRIELDARGEFTLAPNGDDVVGLVSGGYFDLEHDDGRVERRVRIVRGSGADLERTYWFNGSRTSWDADAARWFSETLILLDRKTAFAVDVRLPVLLQRGGVEAVLTEVAQMTATYPQRIYYSKLFERASVTSEQLVRILETASRNFDSGYEKAELLLAVAKQRSFAEPAHLAFAQMARGIESDYEKRRALTALLSRNDLKPEVVRTMLEATEGMKSDYELAELLISIDRRYAADATTRPFYVRAVSTIKSDYEQRRVLTPIMRSGELDATTTGEIIRTAGSSMKGYELAEFLVQVADKGTLNEATSTEFFNATANVGSDYERRRVLTTLLKKGQLTRAVVEGILTTAGTINSDYECAELLVAVARATKIDDALRPAYEKAAASIKSDYEYGRAMSAVRRSAQSSGQQP